MSWEVVNGITGIISAISAVISIKYVSTNSETVTPKNKLISTYKVMCFLLFCSGWTLCCLAYLLIFEPFGSTVMAREYREFFGYVLSVPSLIVLRFGMSILLTKQREP